MKQNNNFKKLWKSKYKEVSTYTDGLGRGMDKKIINVVTGLNLLGIKTIMSCHGHLNRSLFPYIIFEAENCDKLIYILENFYRVNPLEYSTFLHITDTKGVKRLINYSFERFYVMIGKTKKFTLKNAKMNL